MNICFEFGRKIADWVCTPLLQDPVKQLGLKKKYPQWYWAALHNEKHWKQALGKLS